MSFGTEIVSYIEAISPTVGTVFLNILPPTPDACVAVFESGGLGSMAGFGAPGLKHEYPSVQILVRGTQYDHDAPRLIIDRIWKEMSKIQAVTIGGTLYHMATAIQSPFPLPSANGGLTDENGRRTFVVNFQIEKEISA